MADVIPVNQKIAVEDSKRQQEDLEKIAAQKKAKAKKKQVPSSKFDFILFYSETQQEKRLQKEKDKEVKKSELLASTSALESSREVEMSALKAILERERLQIRDIPSDGNCLYR